MGIFDWLFGKSSNDSKQKKPKSASEEKVEKPIEEANKFFDKLKNPDKMSQEEIDKTFESALHENSLEENNGYLAHFPNITLPFNFKLTEKVRMANLEEVENYLETRFQIPEEEIKNILDNVVKDMIILKLKSDDLYSKYIINGIHTVKLVSDNKDDMFESFFEAIKNKFRSSLHATGYKIPESYEYKEGAKISKESSLNKIDYKWLHYKTEDNLGEFHTNEYVIKIIENNEFHMVTIGSSENLKIEDIFEDIG